MFKITSLAGIEPATACYLTNLGNRREGRAQTLYPLRHKPFSVWAKGYFQRNQIATCACSRTFRKTSFCRWLHTDHLLETFRSTCVVHREGTIIPQEADSPPC